ncbi:hypothetical protein [Anaerobiospirillum succiniciproducens]|uniref:hypothetical protein n=1 Tax=Anaerobiospirillum succiniciproducens TaxID=13335 RepID=UPI0012EB7F21|nr:hypothetical protein [Anaerobiospirillum succiniciproducens]
MEALLLWLKPNSSAKRKLHSHDIIFSTRKLSYNAKVALHPISQRQKSQSIGQAKKPIKAQAKRQTSTQATHQASSKQKDKRAYKRPIMQAASKKANEHTNDWSIKLHAKSNKAWMADRLAKGCGCLIASQKGGGSRKMWLKIGRAQGQLIE